MGSLGGESERGCGRLRTEPDVEDEGAGMLGGQRDMDFRGGPLRRFTQ